VLYWTHDFAGFSMNSVSDCFTALKSRQECALIPFLTAGDPDLETTVAALKALDSNGADLIELGVPYSDPLADGPVIQAAATRALQGGITLDQVLDVVRRVSPEIKAPIILFTYYNPILNRGVDRFLQDIADAGAAGLVVPDMPLEEIEGLVTAATKVGIEVILLVAPTSPQERIQAIANQAQGFIYLVSVTGVTGMRVSIETRVQDLITGLKQMTDKPIGVGFGVSSTDQARQLRAWGADGVIVGSAFVKRLYESAREDRLAIIGEFCRDLKAALQ
jgi:tryptophan synthase alpha chain